MENLLWPENFWRCWKSIPGRYRVMRPVELQNGFIRILVHRLIGVPLLKMHRRKGKAVATVLCWHAGD